MTLPFPSNLQNIKTSFWARDLKFWHTVHHPLCVMCHMWHVMCHLSHVIWHHYSQTVRARELIFWHKVHHPLFVTCHESCVTHVTCWMSFLKNIQIGGGSRWRVCYQQGPTLSSLLTTMFIGIVCFLFVFLLTPV